MPTAPSETVIVTDANILINLIHVARLDLLGTLPAFRFVVPDHVAVEIRIPEQRQQFQAALTRHDLHQESLTAPEELALYAELHRVMGQGEAACLAMAESRGWMVASDERRRFRREVLSRLGEGRLVTTPGLLVLAIRAGCLSVEEADQMKAVLERHRFRMTFGSFRDVISEP
jgi:predicted nucleic acid-binding protein